MKHAALIFSSVILIVVLSCSLWIRADADSRMRGEFADKLTEFDEDIAFYASGPFGKRLVIIPEYADHEPGGQADCDAVLSQLVLDKKAMSVIEGKGFTSIRCGTKEVQ
jgi:hypothetical protein